MKATEVVEVPRWASGTTATAEATVEGPELIQAAAIELAGRRRPQRGTDWWVLWLRSYWGAGYYLLLAVWRCSLWVGGGLRWWRCRY